MVGVRKALRLPWPPVVAYTRIIAVGRKDVVHGQAEVLSVTPLEE